MRVMNYSLYDNKRIQELSIPIINNSSDDTLTTGWMKPSVATLERTSLQEKRNFIS